MAFDVLLTVILIPLLTGMEVDLFMGVHALWSRFVAAESLGHKLMNEAGLSHYTFKLTSTKVEWSSVSCVSPLLDVS
jgi:hypothetical protein